MCGTRGAFFGKSINITGVRLSFAKTGVRVRKTANVAPSAR